jgi:hypothetical protein
LPVPVSPVISTGISVVAIFRTKSKTAQMAGLAPTSSFTVSIDTSQCRFLIDDQILDRVHAMTKPGVDRKTIFQSKHSWPA